MLSFASEGYTAGPPPRCAQGLTLGAASLYQAAGHLGDQGDAGFKGPDEPLWQVSPRKRL